MDRLHPQSIRDLEQLIKLHGANRLITAIREIGARLPTPIVSGQQYTAVYYPFDQTREALNGQQQAAPRLAEQLSYRAFDQDMQLAQTDSMGEARLAMESAADQARRLAEKMPRIATTPDVPRGMFWNYNGEIRIGYWDLLDEHEKLVSMTLKEAARQLVEGGLQDGTI